MSSADNQHTLVKRIEDLSRVAISKDVDEARSIMSAFTNDLGFEAFTYHVVRPPEGVRAQFYLSSYDAAWVKHYLDENYVNVDAVVDQASREVLPFSWRDTQKPRHEGDRQELIFNEASEFGMKNGASVPIHGPAGSYAILNVASDAEDVEFNKRWQENRINLQVFGLHIHEVVIKELYPAGDGQHAPRLSPREKECLLWTARGKTMWEISEILSISHETVKTYLKSSCAKMNVFSKVHAVVKAVNDGYIVP